MKPRQLLFFLLCLALCAGTALGAMGDIRLTGIAGGKARISVDSEGAWHFRQGADTYALAMDQNGRLVFKRNFQPIATGRLKGEKLIMVTPSGAAYLLLKIGSDKIKVRQNATEAPWEFKFKSGKVEVTHLGVKCGKVKYYPDSGKIKAKDRSGSTVAELRGSLQLTGAAGAFLITELSTDKAVCLTLFLLSNGK